MGILYATTCLDDFSCVISSTPTTIFPGKPGKATNLSCPGGNLKGKKKGREERRNKRKKRGERENEKEGNK